MMLRTACLAAILAFAAAPAMAQEQVPEQLQEEAPAASAPINLLADLAEVLGRAHAVRTLCNGDQDSTWRSYMLNLMAYEAGSGDRRAAMTDAFNRGYRGQNRETSSCTAATPAIEASIARRGRELSDEIARGYLH
ncbi:MAG: TIGR02301 family protein [Hyphomonadaceae bacterium]